MGQIESLTWNMLSLRSLSDTQGKVSFMRLDPGPG